MFATICITNIHQERYKELETGATEILSYLSEVNGVQ